MSLLDIDSSALDIEFDVGNPRGSFENLKSKSNEDIDKFISYYWSSARNRRFWSICIRALAIVSGVFAALAVNPLILRFFCISDPNDLLAYVSLAIIIAGAALTCDWAYSVTNKYTNWTSLAFEFSVDKAIHNIAFMKAYLELKDSELTKEKFNEAVLLAQETFKEFRERSSNETKEWANNVQAVLDDLRKSNKTYETEYKSASVKAIEERKKKTEEAKKTIREWGLTIKVEKRADRSEKKLSCVVSTADRSKEVFSSSVQIDTPISTFLKRGRYIVELASDGKVISSAAVTLYNDQKVDL